MPTTPSPRLRRRRFGRRAAAWTALLLGAALCAQAAEPEGAAPLATPAAGLLEGALKPLAPAGARVEIIPGTLDPRLRLAPCTRIEPFLPAGSRPWGRTRVGLRCTEGARAWTVYMPFTVKVLAPATVLRSALPAGTVLGADHLSTAVVDWAASPSPALAQSAAAVGRVLARALVAGEAVRLSDLRTRRWFVAGDTVRIVAVGAGYAVSGEGQALGDGLEGQAVRVRTDSGRVVSGRAAGERRVEVAL